MMCHFCGMAAMGNKVLSFNVQNPSRWVRLSTSVTVLAHRKARNFTDLTILLVP